MSQRTHRSRTAPFVLLAGLILAACGPTETPVRLQVEVGRVLVYDLTQRDEFPGPDNPAVEVEARIRLTCTEFAPEGGALYDVVVERLKVSSPERVGLSLDTSTPETEPGDKVGAEELVRGLLGIKAQLQLSRTGRPQDIRSRPELIDPIKAWAREDPGKKAFLGGMLAKLVDGSVIAGTSTDMLANLMPEDAGAPGGSTWSAHVPAAPEALGVSLSALAVKLTRPAPNRAVLVGTATLTPSGGAGGKVIGESEGGLQSGSLEVSGELDTARGILRRVQLVNTMTLLDPSGSGRTAVTTQTRTLVLVEDAAK